MCPVPKLLTDFFAVAQSGPTADGRTIEPQVLLDMAETYSPSTYLAKIWPEHLRYSPLGEVHEVRATQDANGLVTLENRIAPSERLIGYVRSGMLTQPSIEFIGNFAMSGKAYQVGLGVTDEPASLGADKIPVTFKAEADQQRIQYPISIFRFFVIYPLKRLDVLL